jgi:hypothetical protein
MAIFIINNENAKMRIHNLNIEVILHDQSMIKEKSIQKGNK